MERKCILNIRIARELITAGFPIVSVEPSRKLQGQAVFIFEKTPQFDVILTKLIQR